MFKHLLVHWPESRRRWGFQGPTDSKILFEVSLFSSILQVSPLYAFFSRILQDPRLSRIYLMVDALGNASGAQFRTGPTPAFIATFSEYDFPHNCKRKNVRHWINCLRLCHILLSRRRPILSLRSL